MGKALKKVPFCAGKSGLISISNRRERVAIDRLGASGAQLAGWLAGYDRLVLSAFVYSLHLWLV